MNDDSIELDVLEPNELVFNVNVEGANAAHRARLVIKGSDVSYSFEGKPTTTKNNVVFLIPEGLVAEGSYPSMIEVIVGNRYLTPMKFSTVFKRSVATDSKLVEAKKSEKLVECNVSLRSKKTLKDKWLTRQR